MLEQDRKANIISNPRITTVDNREAKILVGQKIPLIVQDVAGNPVSQLQTIGIQLKVTPHLTQDKKVVMDLHPEVSDLSTQSTVQGGVIINTSEADTRVMVDDGQTAVIGGLIRTNESSVRRGVPLLKDLPLLGFLFRSSNTVHQNRELIIFVTPRIVEPGGDQLQPARPSADGGRRSSSPAAGRLRWRFRRRPGLRRPGRDRMPCATLRSVRSRTTPHRARRPDGGGQELRSPAFSASGSGWRSPTSMPDSRPKRGAPSRSCSSARGGRVSSPRERAVRAHLGGGAGVLACGGGLVLDPANRAALA